MGQNLLERDFIGECVTTIFVNTTNNKFGLLLSEEVIFLREGWNEQEADDSQEQGNGTLNNLGSAL
jgi:hypothetical protein